MLKRFRTLAAAAALIGGAAMLAAPASAQREPASSLAELLNRVRQDSAALSSESREREARFRQRVNEQQRLLDEATAEYEALVAEGEELTEEFNANDERIIDLEEQLRQAQGDFGELFGVARQAATDVGGLIDASIISAQFPNRSGTLNEIATSSTLPTRRDLDTIWTTMLHEMVHQRDVAEFTTRVGNLRNNAAAEAPVIRVGSFTAFADDRGRPRFLDYDASSTPSLTVLARDPVSAVVGGARNLINANPGQLVAGPVDPSRGELLGLVVDTPTWRERVDQGGIVGYITLGIMALGVAFGLFRIIVLTMTAARVRAQARSSRAGRGNPLGRIMLVAEEARGSDLESFELRLDEAIIRESSGLDFGLNFLKLAAGIAPLLGLLGTVTGMIVTFQQITLFGTGDPRIMADGISQALVTTMLGLIAAIPLLLIHSFTSSASRSVQQILEEQAAGIVAEQAQQSRG